MIRQERVAWLAKRNPPLCWPRNGASLRQTRWVSQKFNPSLYGLRLLSGVLCRLRRVAAASEQAGDGNIFVERIPVQANAADFDLSALGRCCP